MRESQVVTLLLSQEFTGRVFVLGRNQYTAEVHKLLKHAMIPNHRIVYVDEFNDRVLKSLPLAENDIMVVASGGRIFEAMTLARTTPAHVVHYFDLLRYADFPLMHPIMNELMQEEYDRNAAEFEWCVAAFADKQSREEYRRVLDFRLSLDTQKLPQREDLQHRQYFDELVPRGAYQLVDVGAFDGDTIERFRVWSTPPLGVLAIEPSKQLSQILRQKYAHDNVLIVNAAASAETGTGVFYEDGSRSRIVSLQEAISAGVSNGVKSLPQHVPIITLDYLLLDPNGGGSSVINNDQATFVKMDIEGLEIDALNGATEYLKRYQPTLAIACYHSPEHFWKVPQLVKKILPEHGLFFRHYTQSLYESVVYAIPGGN